MTSPDPKNRKVLDFHGRRGRRGYVRIFRERVGSRDLVRVQWRDPVSKKLTTESWDDTRKGLAEAKAFALGKHESLTEAPAPVVSGSIEPLSLRELRDQYFTAHENAWEPKTLAGKAQRWKLIELGLGRDTQCSTVTPKQLDAFVTWLVSTPVKRVHKKRSVNQVRMTIETVTAAFRWAVDRGILAPTRVMTYRAKLGGALKKQVVQTAEYSADERARLVAALDPRDPTQWRAWALNTVFAFCGPRQTAARFLTLENITLGPVTWKDGEPVFSGRIHWPEETDKMDTAREQPMPSPVAEAFWIALGWRVFDEYTGPFLFYGAQRRTRGQALRRDTGRAKAKESLDGVEVDEKPYTYSALNRAMRQAEDRAGIEHINYRSTHGHRRGVSGDIHSKTGSSKKAADYIGDRSTKIVEKHYLLTRSEDLDASADLVTETMTTAARTSKTKRHETQQGAAKGAPVKPSPSKEGRKS